MSFMGAIIGSALTQRYLSSRITSHMLDETQGITTRKTDPLPDLSTISEPHDDQRHHYSGKRSRRPRGSALGSINVPDSTADTPLTRERKRFTPTTGPQPEVPLTNPTTGQQGQTGAFADHPHTAGKRADTRESKDVKTAEEIFTGKPTTSTPVARTLVSEDIVRQLKKKRKAMPGLPEVSDNNVDLVRLARASYILEQNKYNTVL